MILENKTKSINNIGHTNSTDQLQIMSEIPYEHTPLKSTTATAYNGAGGKLFTLEAEGQWQFNGSDVQATFGDGDFKRHFWGSTLNIDVVNRGSERPLFIGGYKYSEIYTKAYVESVFGIRWAGIVYNSFNAEVYVGATQTGNIYGAAVAD